MLFALGLGDEVTAVTHECDHPAEALDRPKVTRDLIGPGLDVLLADLVNAADGWSAAGG
jgi:hypothetical protein